MVGGEGEGAGSSYELISEGRGEVSKLEAEAYARCKTPQLPRVPWPDRTNTQRTEGVLNTERGGRARLGSPFLRPWRGRAPLSRHCQAVSRF